MKIIISPKAEKQLKKLPKFDQIIVAQKIRFLKTGSNLDKEEKLQGYKNIFRVRAGNYRIVYQKSSSLLYIILIRHRKEVYDLLKQLLD